MMLLKLKVNKNPTAEEIARLHAALAAIDLDAWCHRLKVGEVKAEIFRQLGFKVSRHQFEVAKDAVCRWWRKVRFPTPLRAEVLEESGWRELRQAVIDTAHLTKGRTIEDAAIIVSTRFRCNTKLLSGLVRDFQIPDVIDSGKQLELWA